MYTELEICIQFLLPSSIYCALFTNKWTSSMKFKVKGIGKPHKIHQRWSDNFFAVDSDVYHKPAVNYRRQDNNIEDIIPDSSENEISESAQKSIVLLPNLQGPSEGLYYGLEPTITGSPIYTPDVHHHHQTAQEEGGAPGSPIFTPDIVQHPLSSTEEPVVPGVPIFIPDLQQQPPPYSDYEYEPLDAVTPNSVDFSIISNGLDQHQSYAIDGYNSYYETTTYAPSFPVASTIKCKFTFSY